MSSKQTTLYLYLPPCVEFGNANRQPNASLSLNPIQIVGVGTRKSLDAWKQRMEYLANTPCLESSKAGAADENVIEYGNPTSEASDTVESRSRYQVRSMSMPVIKAFGERPSIGTLSTGTSQKGSERHELRLPSFKALGIAVPHPDHLLTPPEEPDQLAWHPMSQPLPHRQDYDLLQSFHRPTQRLTPEDEQTMTAPLDTEGAGQSSYTTSIPQAIEPVEEEPTMRPNSSSSEEESSGEPVWIEHAIDAVGKFHSLPI